MSASAGLEVRSMSRTSRTWRVLVALVGIALLLNGSLRMSDDVWPFGPMSQYAFSPPADDTIVVTRVEARLADGRRVELPLRVSVSGISRAEVEARVPAIEADPSLLRGVVRGWSSRHPAEPAVRQAWLVQDVTELSRGRPTGAGRVELATWTVPR